MRVDELHTNEYYRDHALHLAPGYLDGQVVVISGGGSGMGRAAAWQAARLGAQVVICTRTLEKVERVSQAISQAGFACEHASVDIRDRSQVDDFLGGVFDRKGKIDLLLNSAGGQFVQSTVDLSLKGWNAVVDTNLNGTFNMMQSAARRWLADDATASIVNITYSPRGMQQVAHSLAARAGVTALSEAVAVEWAPNIRVNCIAPGTITSDHHEVDFVERRMATVNPMVTVGTAWDAATACLFIGGPAAPFITGQTLHINGGSNLWGESWPLGKPERLRQATALCTEVPSRDQESLGVLFRNSAAGPTAEQR